MKKNEVLKKLVEGEVVATLTEGEKLLKSIDKVIEIACSEEGKTKIGTYFTVENIAVPEKKGEITRVVDGVKTKTPYTKKAHNEIVIKRTSICKEI